MYNSFWFRMFLWEENPWHPWPTIERYRCDVVRLLREGRHWHGRYWWQFTRQTCETTCVKASLDELKDGTIWTSSMYLQQSLEMMRWCIISRPVESIILTTASHMTSLCLNISDVIAEIGLNMNCLFGALGKIFKWLLLPQFFLWPDALKAQVVTGERQWHLSCSQLTSAVKYAESRRLNAKCLALIHWMVVGWRWTTCNLRVKDGPLELQGWYVNSLQVDKMTPLATVLFVARCAQSTSCYRWKAVAPELFTAHKCSKICWKQKIKCQMPCPHPKLMRYHAVSWPPVQRFSDTTTMDMVVPGGSKILQRCQCLSGHGAAGL